MNLFAKTVAIGAAAFVVTLLLGRKKSAAASGAPAAPPDDPDHIEPPPDRPPYKDPPTKTNPVGSYPGIQHFMLDRGGQLPDPVNGPTVGGKAFYVNRAPESSAEAAKTFAPTGGGGEFPLHVFSGSTAFVRDMDPSNPFADTNVKLILLNGAWVPWTSANGADVGFGPVVFQATADGVWRRITPA